MSTNKTFNKVQLDVKFTQATSRVNLISEENISISFGKISKYFADLHSQAFTGYTHPTYTARTGKPTGNQTPGFGSTFTISQITSDGTGHVTAATDRTVKIPDTTMGAASADAAGSKGLVPAPAAGKQTSFLRGDGTWAIPTNTDTKVTQSQTTTTNYRPILFGANNSTDVSTLANTITDQAYTSTKMYAQPSTGLIFCTGRKIENVTIQTGSTKQAHITLQTLMTWLITTKTYIPSGQYCHVIISTTWVYENNDILQVSIDGTNYEIQLAGVIIEFIGGATSYNAGMFRLLIHSSPTINFTATSGYSKFPVSTIAEYTCNGSDYSPTWKKIWNSHPTYTSKSSGLYKITVDGTGHVSAATAVAKADITALGIPGSDTNTTYAFATGDAVGQFKVTPSGGTATNYNVNGIAAGTASGTAKHLAYYSSATSIVSSGNLMYSVENSTASTPRSRTILHIFNSNTVGNDAAALISGTKGVLSYGDGGPQINFSTGSTIGGAQDSAIIWTDNDSAAAGASWHFVSSQSDWNVISKRFHARTGISIGTNLPNTSYNLYVNGTSQFNGTTTISTSDFGTQLIVERTTAGSMASVTFKNPSGILGHISANTVDGDLYHYGADTSKKYIILDTGNTSFTRTLSSGTKIGTIKIGGTSTDLYCQTNTNTDTKVKVTTSTSKAYLIGTTTSPDGTAVEGVGNTGVYMTNGVLTASSIYGSGAESQSTAPTGGYRIYDCRSVNVSPNDGDKAVNFYFHMTDMPDTSLWWSVLHMRGWTGAYAAWEIAGPSDNKDQRTKPLYVRTSNTNTAWGSWRKIYDTSNPPTASEVGALASTTKYAGSSSVGGAATSANKLNTNAGTTYRPVYFSGGVPVQCDAPESGSWFKGVPLIGTNGVMEIGKYIDFHKSNDSTADYDLRLQYTGTATGKTITIPGATGTMALLTKGSTSYWGIIDGDGATSGWIRTTTNGFIPATSVSLANGGDGSLGTSSWAFKNAYIANINGVAVGSSPKFTDTTYSAGTGLSLSGTTINHSNSVTAKDNYNKKFFTHDAQGHITETSWYIHKASGTNGSNNDTTWIKIATLVHTSTYNNSPITITFTQRGNTTRNRLTIRFSSTNSNDPSLALFLLTCDALWATSNSRALIVKTATSTWDVYIKKLDTHEVIHVSDFDIGSTGSTKLTWTWKDEQVATTPADATEATKKTYSTTDHTHSYIPMSGSMSVTGNIEITKASGDVGFYAKRSDTGVEVWMGVGSGGTNHGIYSNKLGKWMMYGDATNVYLNGNAVNVTGTVAIANGGTGATTRLAALKALTNEGVGTNAQYFLTITQDWGKGGYSSVANVKTVLGLGTAAYKASSDFAVNQTLANDTNLNNITTPGFYNCGGTNSVTNKPSNVDAFGLNVIHDAFGQWYTQILYPNNASPLIYVRNYNGSAWSGWNSIAIGSFLPLSGGTMTGTLTAKASQYADEYGGALNMNNSNIYGVNAIYTADVSDTASEGIHFYRDSTHVDTLWMNGGSLLFVPNRELGTSTTAANSQKVARFTANPTSGQVVITDGTTGGIKSSGYTIATSVPSGAVFTDQKVRQSATTSEDFRPILMGATHVSGSSTGLDATVTDEAYVSTKLYCQPKTGNLYVAGDIKRVSNTLSLWSGNDCAGVSQRNNCDINTWYGFSVSNACTNAGTLNKVAFSVNARNGQAWHTGNVHLYSASGDSPALVFQRGTFVDNLNDWKIYVSGGALYFAQSTANASSETWTNKMYFHASDGNLYVGSTKVSLEGHTHNYAGSSSAGGAATWATLLKAISTTTTASASTWNIPSGSYQVWGEKFSDTRLKYTPSGGTAQQITDTGDLVMWLTGNATANQATLNMRIDGTYYGSFSGNITGNVTGNVNGKLYHTGTGSAWWDDRDNAVIRITTGDTQYRPLWTLLTATSGSWGMGNHTGDDLTFNFISKAVYDSKKNPSTYAQIKFTNAGGITATGSITANKFYGDITGDGLNAGIYDLLNTDNPIFNGAEWMLTSIPSSSGGTSTPSFRRVKTAKFADYVSSTSRTVLFDQSDNTSTSISLSTPPTDTQYLKLYFKSSGNSGRPAVDNSVYSIAEVPYMTDVNLGGILQVAQSSDNQGILRLTALAFNVKITTGNPYTLRLIKVSKASRISGSGVSDDSSLSANIIKVVAYR